MKKAIRRSPKARLKFTSRLGSEPVYVVTNPALKSEFGITYHRDCGHLVYLAPTSSYKVQAATLLHELIHAVENAHQIPLKERDVRALEVGLCQVLSENPRMARWIIDGITGVPRSRCRPKPKRTRKKNR